MAQFDVTAVFKVSGFAELNKNFRQIGASARDVQRNLGNFGAATARFTRNIAASGATTGAALAGAANRFSEFEKNFTEVVTLLNDSSFENLPLEQGIEGLEQGVIRLRSATGQTFETLNKGLFDLISAGVPAAEAIEGLGVATNLAIAGATDVSVAVDAITTSLGAYGDEAGTANDIAEKFFAAQVQGKTTVEELARSVGLVASQANSAGVSFDELLATVSSATVAGIRTNAAFTGLRGAIDNIQKPTAAAREEAERLGIQFDASALRTRGLIGVLSQVTQSANFTEDSFVQLFGSVEARNFALALANDEFERANNILGSVSNATERTTNFTNALSEQQGTLSFATQRLIGTFDTLAVSVGQTLAPAIASFFNLISDLITEFQPEITAFFEGFGQGLTTFVNNLRENFPQLVATIRQSVQGILAGLRTFFTAVQEAFGIIAPIFRQVIDVLDIIARQFGVANGTVLLLVAAFFQLTGGTRVVITLIQLLTSVFGLLRVTVLLGVIPLITRLGTLFITLTTTTRIFSAVLTALRLVLVALRVAFLAIPIVALIAGIVLLIDELVGLENIWKAIVDIVKEFGPIVIDGAKRAAAAVGEFFEGFLALAGRIITEIALIPARLIGIFNPQLGEQLVSNIRQSFEDLGRRIVSIFTGVVDRLRGIFSSVANFLRNTVSQITNIGRQASQVVTNTSRTDSPNRRTSTFSRISDIPGFASGGAISGPGSGTSDSILARLSNGEYVINAGTVKKFGTDMFDLINRGIFPTLQGFRDGGLVNAVNNSVPSAAVSSRLNSVSSLTGSPVRTGRPLNLILPSGDVVRATTDEDTAQKLQRNLRRSDNAKSSQLPRWY